MHRRIWHLFSSNQYDSLFMVTISANLFYRIFHCINVRHSYLINVDPHKCGRTSFIVFHVSLRQSRSSFCHEINCTKYNTYVFLFDTTVPTVRASILFTILHVVEIIRTITIAHYNIFVM